jgi:hypothetical protein
MPVEHSPTLLPQLRVCPWMHAHVSSTLPLQLSSTPLQVSAGGTQGCHIRSELHVRIPAVPHAVEHVWVFPGVHSPQSSSIEPSQSLSRPSPQTSDTGPSDPSQDPHDPPEQILVPDTHSPMSLPQVWVAPFVQEQPSSVEPSQLSSTPLQVSD